MDCLQKKITTALVVGGKGPVAPADGTRVYSCKYFDSEYVFDFLKCIIYEIYPFDVTCVFSSLMFLVLKSNPPSPIL
jgi:hypothetical protein